MFSPVPSPVPVDNSLERLMDPLKEQSPQSSFERTESNKSDANKTQVQPAVDNEADKIETRSSPSASSKPVDSPPADLRRSSTISTVTSMMTVSCREVTKTCCEYKVWILIFLALFMDLLISFRYRSLVELHIACLSLLGYGIVVCCKPLRGKWARQPEIQLPENKRNPYRDVPSLCDEDPMEPTCPRPQQEPPKEQVYQAVVHNPNLPTAHSSPSTSTAAEGVDTKGASGGHPPSTPSTSEVEVASVNVHVTPQETETKEESKKDS